MERRQKALLTEINHILFETWDPIGISDSPDAPRDEYSSYASRVFVMLLEGSSQEAIRRELDSIAQDYMGLRATTSEAAARECVAAYRRITNEG